jgi:hypothetical protein
VDSAPDVGKTREDGLEHQYGNPAEYRQRLRVSSSCSPCGAYAPLTPALQTAVAPNGDRVDTIENNCIVSSNQNICLLKDVKQL